MSFTRGYLGFTDVTLVINRRTDALGAHIRVGRRNPACTLITAAVLHLVRFGTDGSAPWEVAGSDDTTFSLERPAYGATVTSPMTLGGRITGVDESIHILGAPARRRGAGESVLCGRRQTASAPRSA